MPSSDSKHGRLATTGLDDDPAVWQDGTDIPVLQRKPLSTIRGKLAVYAVLLAALTTAVLYVFFPSQLEEQATEAITRKATVLADMTAYVIGIRGRTDYDPDVNALLRASVQVEDLVYIFLTRPDGTVISQINRDPGRYFPATEIRQPSGLGLRGDIYRVRRAVIQDGVQTATLHLAVSLEPLMVAARRSRMTIAAACIFIFLVGFAGLVLLGRKLTAPLKQIVSIAEKISDGELHHRVEVVTDDEIGQLGTSFNRMVDGLKSAYQHLESANATLAYHSEDLQAEIVQKKKAEEALRASEAKFRAVVEHATDVVAVLNEAGRIRYVSPATIHMMGVTPESLVGQQVIDNVHPEDRANLQQALSQGKSPTGVIEAEARWRHANGTWRYLAFRGRNLRSLPGINGLLFNVTDITDSKRAESELVVAKERAEEMAALKDSFLTNMSHEIRTPLTGILGFAQILKAEVGDEHGELVEHIERSGNRLLDTLNAVLELAELAALSGQPDLGRVAVGHQIREAVHIVNPVAQLKNLDVKLNLPPEEIFAHANPNCLLRALTNLTSNAVKFTDSGGVAVSMWDDGERVLIEVKDTGVGISDSFMPSLFGEFTQESTGNSRTHEGSGLGLAITYRLIELMDGTISVDSKKGRGTTFTLSLPLADRQTALLDGDPLQGEAGAGTRLQTIRLLRSKMAS